MAEYGVVVQVSDCMMYKAATGTEEDYQNYIVLLKENIKIGRLSQISCFCNPPCTKPTREQKIALNEKLEKEDWWIGWKRQYLK